VDVPGEKERPAVKRVDPGGRFVIVASRFNAFVVELMVQGCVEGFRSHGIDPETRVDVMWVPGAFEIPTLCGHLARRGQHASIVAIGAVIRGETAHFEYVAGAAARGVASVSRKTGVPCIFGVLTTETVEQAMERADPKRENHGYHAACAAIEMATLLNQWEA
jgi:6,7-dimethyl-8-ribityllumazine synthase